MTDTPYTRRARYFDSGNAFNVVNPPVPGRLFRGRWRGQGLVALGNRVDATRERPFASRRKRPARQLADRPGRRLVLSLPQHGLSLRIGTKP
jgi:hypothetical protein